MALGLCLAGDGGWQFGKDKVVTQTVSRGLASHNLGMLSVTVPRDAPEAPLVYSTSAEVET